MFKEIGNSIKAILYDRAVSPLSGVVALVWIGFNWKAIAVLLWGHDDITARITHIENHYVDVWRNLYYPLLSATAILLLYPFAALAAYALWERVASWKLGLKQRFEGTVALPVAKSLAIWTEMREKDKQFGIAIEAKDNRMKELENHTQALATELNNLKESLSKGTSLEAEIAKRTEQLAVAENALRLETQKQRDAAQRLKTQDEEMSRLRGMVSELQQQHAPSLPQLDEQEQTLLDAVAFAEDRSTSPAISDVFKRAGLTRVEARHYLDSLKQRDFVYVAASEEGGEDGLFLQPAARAYLVAMKRSKTA
jgi:hypothetical protein